MKDKATIRQNLDDGFSLQHKSQTVHQSNYVKTLM